MLRYRVMGLSLTLLLPVSVCCFLTCRATLSHIAVPKSIELMVKSTLLTPPGHGFSAIRPLQLCLLLLA